MKRCLIFLIILIPFASMLKGQAHIGDSLALVALYNNTNGPSWSEATNWLQPGIPVSDWDYVSVNSEGRVTRLSLGMNNMSGTLPSDIGDLTMLTFLDFQNNTISGTVPAEIGNLVNLEYLILSGNEFTGQIPDGINNLTKLIALHIADNDFSGQLPAMGNLTDLKIFSCYENELSGSLPVDMGTWQNLEDLQIFKNHFTGPMPEGLSVIPALKNFVFGENCFTFSDLEQFVGNSLDYFGYWPQSQIITTSQVNFATGDNLELDITQLTVHESAATNNQYKWGKDGTDITSYSSSPLYVIADLDNSDEGYFYCTMTNSDWPNLILSTDSIKLVIDGPVGIQLTNDSIDENVNPGTLIGTLTISDPDQADGHILSFSDGEYGSGEDNEFFTLNGEQLTINISPDYETKQEYRICIRATDNEDQTFDKSLLIQVNDLPDGTGIDEIRADYFNIYPNPLMNDATIELILPADSYVNIDIIDLQGKIIESFSGCYTAGIHSIEMTPGEKVQPGIYICQIRTSEYIGSKMCIVK